MSAECAGLAERTYRQLSSGGYRWPCSAFELQGCITDHLVAHRTMRKRCARAQKLGYRFETIDRTMFEEDVFEVNTSAPSRQGRPMSDGYLKPVVFSPLPAYPCVRHGIHTYGVLDRDGRLRAYTWVYRVGDLVMFSQILGHADHLRNDVMYLLMVGALNSEIVCHGPGVAWYNMHSGGTPGLVFYKTRCGFRPTEVRWELA